MSSLKYWDGNAWVTIGSVPGPQGPMGPSLLDMQKIDGNQEVISPGFNVGTDILVDASTPMKLTYTPPVDCWWEIEVHVGNVVKVDAAYHSISCGFLLSPTDVDGAYQSLEVGVQHTSVNANMGRTILRVMKLQGGITYTATAKFLGGTGGTWAYSKSKSFLWMTGKAWSR